MLKQQTQFAKVRTANNEWIECKVIEVIPCSYSLFAQIAVKAIHGRPFDGHNIAIVPSHRVNFIDEKDLK